MRVAFAFIARAADYADGKLFVLGGDIDTIQAAGFPLAIPALSFVAKFVFSPEEREREHALRLEVSGPRDRRVVHEGSALPLGNPRPDRDAGSCVIVNAVLQVEQPGDYRVHFIVDGTEAVSLPLYIEQSDAPT